MTAAAIASSSALRSRQSFSRRASRLSASRLLRRSSCNITGTAIAFARPAPIACTVAVTSVGSPSSRRGNPMTTAASPSSSCDRSRIIGCESAETTWEGLPGAGSPSRAAPACPSRPTAPGRSAAGRSRCRGRARRQRTVQPDAIILNLHGFPRQATAMACARCVPGRIHAGRLRYATARHRPSEAGHPRLRRHGPGARRPLDARGPAAQHLEALGRRQRAAARDDALARVADRVGVVCHRREPRQAQHLRLPRPRHGDLPARPRHGAPRAAEVPVQLHSRSPSRSSSRPAAARRSGSRPGRPACARASSPCR